MLDFHVVFNSKINVFFPGTEAIATVILNTDQTIKARKIDIKIIGQAKTYWTEYEYQEHYGYHGTNDGYSQSIPYGSTIVYLNSYAVLWASQDGSNLLPAGQYQFPLKFSIPSNAPPNMSGEYGSVTYYVKANIDIPWAVDESRFVGFSVCPLIDLNLDSKLVLPVVTAATEMESACCSCSSYPMTANVSLPKTGFVPGETIAVTINLQNATSAVVTNIELGISANMMYQGSCQANFFHGYSYYRQPNMTKLTSNAVTSKQYAINSKESSTAVYSLQVPPIAPSNAYCSIITLSYTLYIKVHTDAVFSSGPVINIPITIGTVPLRSNNPPAAQVLANANFTNITIENKTAAASATNDGKKEDGPPAGYQAQVPFYSDLNAAGTTPTQNSPSTQ